MKNKNIIISMILVVILTITSNMFSITSSAGVSDNLFQNDLTSLIKKDKDLQSQIDNITNKVYPVGSIYLTYDNTDPSSKFGGTWEKLESGRMLMSGDIAGQTGGNNSVRLDSSQIPSLSVSGTTDSTGGGMSASISSYTYADRTGSTSTNGNHAHTAIYWQYGAPGGMDALGNIGVASIKTPEIDINADANTCFGNKTANNIFASGDHSHTVYYRDYYANGVSVSGLTAHTHTFTGTYVNNSQQSIDITNPYITVFMWKRIK